MNRSMEAQPKANLVTELVGGEPYEYYPLGDHIVRAVGVCGGRPTFKYTRIDVDFILNELAHGCTVSYLVEAYRDSHLTEAAIQEAITLARSAFKLSVAMQR
ncbi:MAG: DUF433 domain-containing protein [Caldilinea sp. CFX5]|nr:DUF433 domain-containing protein [Caldilinea sp. CFX5]